MITRADWFHCIEVIENTWGSYSIEFKPSGAQGLPFLKDFNDI
jgi:hypothetical protein